MKNKLIIIVSFLFFGLNNKAYPQNSNFLWAKQMGGTSSDYGNSIAVDANGNVYTTGMFQGTADFDPNSGTNNLTSAGSNDIFVSKLDASGNFLWAKQMGGANTDQVYSIAVDANGNVYTTGLFIGTSDFNPGTGIFNLTSLGTIPDIFVSKLDASGNFLWAKKMGGTNTEQGYSIVVDANGNVYTTGIFKGTADFDPSSGTNNLTSVGDYDIFVSKLDASGNFLWAKKMGGISWDQGSSIAVDANRNVYTTGYFFGTVDFDPGSSTYNLTATGRGTFVSKLDSSGNFLFAKQFSAGTGNAVEGNSIILDANGNIYTTGDFTGTIDFDPSSGTYNLASPGNNDIFVSKLDASGNFLWSKQMGGASFERGYSIAIDANGNVYTTGYFNATADFDPSSGIYNLTSAGNNDIFVSKLDVSGNFLWAKQMGGASSDNGNSIAVDANGNVYTTGIFQGTADFNPSSGTNNLTSAGNTDIFVMKLKGNPVVYTLPKIYISKASLNVGQTQTIIGKDFTTGGLVNLIIKNSSGDLIPVNTITYLPNGGFTYQLPITAAMLNGEYSVYATDINTGQTTATIRFRVNNPVLQNLIVTEPTALGSHIVNTVMQIRWADFISNSSANGVSGFVQKKYKIEASNNSGTTWQTIVSNKIFPQVQSNQTKEFAYSYAFAQAGTYIIKVTDLDNLPNNNTSVAFNVIAAGSGSFTNSLEWDNSFPLPINISNPIGLAADGTSRIIIKLTKDAANIKAVKNIHASIIDLSGNATGTDLIGKIKPAKVTAVYSDEANNANATSCDTVFVTPSNNPNFSFWLVSPDDFTQTANSGAAERVIKVDFTITYSDNTTATVSANHIRIVRPPLLMVHGLNGSSESFANAKFDIGNGPTNFKNVINNQTIWKYGKLPTLINYGSYDRNAVELLGSMDNSFKAVINQIRSQGYASNKVDYVCHSMGGCIARTVINKYPAAYFSNNNYKKGFINKLITINTPHNGSPVADLVVDLLPSWYVPVTFSPTAADPIKGFFVQGSSNIFGSYYIPSPAIKDLRAVNGGIRFGTTSVKNHVIGGDIDRYNVPDAALILALNGNNSTKALLALFGLTLPGAATGTDAFVNSINAYISLHYGYPNYLSNSDVVVPVSSQFPSLNINSIPEVEDINTIFPATNSYGLNRNHLQITDDIAVGTKVMRLLNSSINSGYFANQMAANPNGNSSAIYKVESAAQASDSILNYIDTVHVKIVNPKTRTNLYVDSTSDISVFINDTVGLKRTQLFFQGDYYESSSKVASQTFNVKVQSNAIGLSMLMIKGIYDSLGFTICHSDTVVINIVSADTLKGFYVSQKSQNLNSNQFFLPSYNAVYTTYIGSLNNNIDSLTFSIADTNVVKYVDSVRQFITKDTGTTHIIFNYKGFTDSAFIYVGFPVDESITNACTQGNVTFFAGTNDNTKTYQWQADTGNGFENIVSGSVYSGADNPTLTLTNPPTNWYNYRYRCLISDLLGQTTSQIYTLRFASTWTGAIDNTWENLANWGCGSLPDDNTDVIINTAVPRFPQVNSTVYCRSLTTKSGVSVTITTGNNLIITR
jgi:pimeloyl-ACP methyl ester carboxylesterase